MPMDPAPVKRIYELFNSGKIEEMLLVMTPESVFHVPGKVVGGDKVGPEAMGKFFETLASKASKLGLEIHDIATSDNLVVAVVQHHHERGDKKCDLWATHSWHLENGTPMEMWEMVWDTGEWDAFWA